MPYPGHVPPDAGTSTPELPRRAGRAWLGLALRTLGTGLVVAAALGAVLVLVLLFDADPDVRGGAVVLLVAALLAAGAGVLARRAGRRCGPTPNLDVLSGVIMVVGTAVGLVLGPVAVVAGGIWLVVVMLTSDATLPERMVAVALGVFAVVLMALVSVSFLRTWRGTPAPGGDGSPSAYEWVVAGLVVGLTVVLVVAGVLELRSDGDYSLLVSSLLGAVAVVGAAHETRRRRTAHRGPGRHGHGSPPS